jgi:hypothetical protein
VLSRSLEFLAYVIAISITAGAKNTVVWLLVAQVGVRLRVAADVEAAQNARRGHRGMRNNAAPPLLLLLLLLLLLRHATEDAHVQDEASHSTPGCGRARVRHRALVSEQ